MARDDGAGLAWKAVARDVQAVRRRLGFGSRLAFLHHEVLDGGEVMFTNPVTSKLERVDERVERIAWRVLAEYNHGDESFTIPAGDERYTRVSLLDDSMHLGCSTNQHRIEARFQDMFDVDTALTAKILETWFDAARVDKGDLAFKVSLLPRVPVLVVYNAGEDDLPSNASIFFEVNTTRFLSPNTCESLEELFVLAVESVVDATRPRTGKSF